ncbi:substrate-binding periplasmic protein [Azospirillum sp. ST 5-10]|uniref:substrate-binding periplasmic protein n=1 Tax=unclassified Azospirillum TaxID=2630922 RepID=UPI003F4A1AEE
MPIRSVAAALAALVAVALSAVAVPAAAQDKVVKLTSLDWPPFSGEALKDKGAATAVVKAAFAAMGYRVEVDFFPWNRAVAMVRDGTGHHGYFPEYDGAAVREEFTLSVPLGTSPLGFAERADSPVTWSTLDDLKTRRIGIVDGYVNTEAFDAMVASGALAADKANSDTTNLKKLLARRIDLAVIDRAVMDDLLRTTPDLKAQAAALRFNPTILEEKSLHIAFRKDASGAEMARVFAEGLGKIDAAAILRTALGS